MKKQIGLIALSLVAIGIGSAHADILSELGGAVGGYKKTILVEMVEVQPAKDTDSYFLVYGWDTKTGKFNIIELQINWLSISGNLDSGFGGDLNRDMLKYVTELNIGNEITYECNGFERTFNFMEEYPQCFKIIDIKENPKPKSSELEQCLMVATEQMKVLRDLVQ